MKKFTNNPRQISAREAANLARDLERFGDLSGIVHNARDDEIIGGNQRMSIFGLGAEVVVTEALPAPDEQGTIARGYVIWKGKRYTYRRVDWDRETAEAANLIANLRGGKWDWDVLANWDAKVLFDVGFDRDLLKDWKRDVTGLDAFIKSEKDAGADAEPEIDRGEELRAKWGVELGQLWRIGEHRLICGDCTDPAVVARVMGGERAQLVVTSPPYSVGKEYEAGVNFEDHLKLLRSVADRCIENVVPGGFIFTNFGEIAALSHAGPLKGSKR